MNCEVLVKADAGYVPFKTWYVSNAATAAGSVAAAAPAVELRKVARASLLGARMVILDAPPRASRRAGSAEIKEVRELRVSLFAARTSVKL